MGDGEDADDIIEEGVNEAVAEALHPPLADPAPPPRQNHLSDLGMLKDAADGVIDGDLEALGDMAVVGPEVLGLVDELGSGVRMEAVATSGRSLGHAP